MTSFQKYVLREMKKKYTGLALTTPPPWLEESRWSPVFCMAIPNDTRVIAVDTIPSASIPRTIYSQEVCSLISQHPELRVIVCVMDNVLASFPDTVALCHEMGCGLQTLIPEVGLKTLLTTDLDKMGTSAADIEPGWFPRHILDRAQNLSNLSFHRKINRFCQNIAAYGDDEAAVTAAVKATIDQLLQDYPRCHPDVGSFMKLDHFETIFRQAIPNSTEHVLHSFRVFLIGCAIIDRFYDKFQRAHERLCVGNVRGLCVEYCWLLTAIFHDIGRRKESTPKLVETDLEDDDMVVSIRGKETRWLREDYKGARRILASLGAFVASDPTDNQDWDAAALTDDKDEELSSELTMLYDEMSSHAVISAFDMLASIVKEARAVNERKNRPFVVTHATPAALAILLHDWRIWEHARKWRLYPVDCGILPMAALLIFVDTWDDFKRKGPISPISVDSFLIDDGGASVTITWHEAEDYEKEKVKYSAFERALKNHIFRMSIDAKVKTV